VYRVLNVHLALHIDHYSLAKQQQQLYLLNDLYSKTTWVTWQWKGKLLWILMRQELIAWQRHQLEHMQIILENMQIICSWIMPAAHHSVTTGRVFFLVPNQQCWSTEGNTPKHKTQQRTTDNQYMITSRQFPIYNDLLINPANYSKNLT